MRMILFTNQIAVRRQVARRIDGKGNFRLLTPQDQSTFAWLHTLKVSKFQKQIILSSHSPKNQRNFSHFSALASKKSWKIVQTQDESTKILIWCYLTQWNSFIALIRPLLKARAKNVKNFVGFLGNEKTRLFAFEIYWPLGNQDWGTDNVNVFMSIYFFLTRRPSRNAKCSKCKTTSNLI